MCCKQLPAKSNQDKIKCLEEEAKYIERDLSSESSMELGLFTIKAVANQSNCDPRGKWHASSYLIRHRGFSVIDFYQGELKRMPLESTSIVLKTYTGEKLELKGQAMVQVRYHDQEAKLPLLVVKGTGPSLLGHNWLLTIRLNWGEIKNVS